MRKGVSGKKRDKFQPIPCIGPLGHEAWISNAEIGEHLKVMLKGCKRIGINTPEVSYAAVQELQTALPRVKLVDVSKAVLRARLVKDDDEIRQIKKACVVASRVAKEIPGFLEEGMLFKLYICMH